MKTTQFLMTCHLVPFLMAFSVGATPLSHQNPGTSYMDEPNTLIQNPRQITFTGERSGEGYFSPDGNWMVFQSEREPGNPFYQIYFKNLKNGEVRRISTGYGKTTCAWVHPSMKKVLFSSTHLDPDWKKKAQEEMENRKKEIQERYSWSYDENFDIFSSDISGKNLVRLTKEKGYDAEGSYSPDGKWVVFASNRKGYEVGLSPEDRKFFERDPSYMMDIYIMKADGSAVRQLTSEPGYDGGPFFSPDGTHITWRRFSPAGDKAEIYTMRVDGADQKKITDLKSMSWAPYYHPSGDYLIFTSSVLGYSNFELFIVDTEGKKMPIRVTFKEGFDGLPVFTPDGSQLTWSRSMDKKNAQIFLADWDDLQARRLLGLPPRLEGNLLSPQITSKDIEKEISYFADASMKGRATGSPEESLYVERIASLFKEWGLKPLQPIPSKAVALRTPSIESYVHAFEFTSGANVFGPNHLEIVETKKDSRENKVLIQVQKDYIPLSFSRTGQVPSASVVFAGYGVKAPQKDSLVAYDSYRDLDVQGKWVLVLNDIPQDISSEFRYHLNAYSRAQHKITIAKNLGAIGIIFITGPKTLLKEDYTQIKYEGASPDSSMAALRVKRDFWEQFFKSNGQDLKSLQEKLDLGEPVRGFEFSNLKLNAEIGIEFIKSTGKNVIGYLDPQSFTSKGPALMIGAHGDHLGLGDFGNSLAKGEEKGKIHYGADDNASGMAGVLELAHYYSNAFKNGKSNFKKRLYFAIWSGEELGNLGSSQFLKSFQSLNLQGYLNMDMIGRYRDQISIQGIGSGKGWKDLVERQCFKTPLAVHLENDPYLPTDAMSFYMAKVPVVSFFTGSHGEYHTPSDQIHLIQFEKTMEVVNLVRLTADEFLGHLASPVSYAEIKQEERNVKGRGFRIFLGTIPDYTQEGIKGVRITGTSSGSPAQVAGLKELDIIVEFNKLKVENMYDFVYTLQSVVPNRPTTLKVLRDGKIVELSIIPALKE